MSEKGCGGGDGWVVGGGGLYGEGCLEEFVWGFQGEEEGEYRMSHTIVRTSARLTLRIASLWSGICDLGDRGAGAEGSSGDGEQYGAWGSGG